MPIVVVTAAVDPAVRDQALEAGADAYLQKPVESDALRNALDSLGRLPVRDE